MARYSTGGNADFQNPTPGIHPALCYLIADIGYQQTNFGVKPMVVFGFELCDENVEGTNKPLIVYERLTASMNEKANLRAMLTGWRGRPFTDEEAAEFDMKNVIGKPCQVNVVLNEKGGKTFANIQSVVPWPKSMKVPAPSNELLFYDPDNTSCRDKLPQWIKDKLDNALRPEKAAASREAVEDAMAEQSGSGWDRDDPDSIPF
jgi:hypothetical protein